MTPQSIYRFGQKKEPGYITEMRSKGLKLHLIRIEKRREYNSSPTGDAKANYKVSIYCPVTDRSYTGIGTPRRALVTAWKDMQNARSDA